MNRRPARRRFAAALPVAVAAVVALVLGATAPTSASWHETRTLASPRLTTDTLGLGVDPFAGPTTAATELTFGAVLTNSSTAQQGVVEVLRSTIADAPGSETTGGGSPLSITWGLSGADGGASSCARATTLWHPGHTGVGTVTRAGDLPAAARLDARASARLCGDVQTGSLLSHAGRAYDVSATVRLDSRAPATWTSETSTLSQRVRVRFPAPTTPASVPACTTGISYETVRWGWPTASDTEATSTPAVDRFVLVQSVNGGPWEELRSVSGHERSIHISATDRHAPHSTQRLKIRAYLFSGSSHHVDSDFFVPTYTNLLGVVGGCDGPPGPLDVESSLP